VIFGFLVPILFLIILIVVARKLFVRDGHGAPSTFSIRRLFQYALLFGLLSVSEELLDLLEDSSTQDKSLPKVVRI